MCKQSPVLTSHTRIVASQDPDTRIQGISEFQTIARVFWVWPFKLTISFFVDKFQTPTVLSSELVAIMSSKQGFHARLKIFESWALISWIRTPSSKTLNFPSWQPVAILKGFLWCQTVPKTVCGCLTILYFTKVLPSSFKIAKNESFVPTANKSGRIVLQFIL